MTLPVKPISEIEVKSEVSENDKILILDSESEEARLASKDELKGDKGDTGEKGDKGDKGDTGATGPQGPQGLQGPQGDTGAKGDKGDKGDRGETGATGPQGIQGVKGDKGDKGDTGATGSKGDKGDKGDTGTAATITVGSTTTGDAGSSASVVNSGTSSAAVLDFTIPKGDKGDQGVQGETGPAGEDGKDGEDGADGNGITSVTSSKNGKTTTVTMNFDEGDPYSFQIMDGADGQGSGDMMKSVYDPNNKAADAFDYDNFINTPTLGTAASCNTGTSSGSVPVLDSNGKLSTTILPALAITDTFTVSTTSDLTGLSSAEKGDIAIVTGTSETYILSADPYSTSSNWKKLATPTDTVTSVNSKTGAVTLDADDISDSTTTNKFVTATEKSTWDGKQNALSTQTAYTSKGSATKVPQITTNTLGQVTGITEVTITQPDVSGLVTGPSSATDGNIAVFDGTTGKIVKDGGAIPTGLPSGGTTGQVVTKTANGAEWANAASNVKVFELSSVSDTTNATAAYSWYVNGGIPIIKLGAYYFTLTSAQASVMLFSYSDTNGASTGTATSLLYVDRLYFSISNSAVTTINRYTGIIKTASSAPTTGDNRTITFVI